MDRMEFAAGEVLVRAGYRGDYAYIIESGIIELLHGDKADSFSQLHAGEIFGEMALLTSAQREETARAAAPCRLIRIESQQLRRRLHSAEPVVQFLLTALLGALHNRNGSAISPPDGSIFSSNADRLAAVKDLTFEQEISQALGSDQFVPFFQPIVRIENGAPIGFEALARWKHPQRGWVMPQDFIPIAERAGLIGEIDFAILRDSWRSLAPFNAERRRKGQHQLYISINLSADHFNNPGLGEKLRTIVESENMDPHLLKFEITESGLISQPELAHQLLKDIKRIGADISLDDFGTGYSSLSYLHNFPIDIIKIDRSFVRNIKSSEKSCTIVRTILQLAQTVGMGMVAEGIEDPDTAAMILALGCPYGQGYLYSKPLPFENIRELLRADELAMQYA